MLRPTQLFIYSSSARWFRWVLNTLMSMCGLVIFTPLANVAWRSIAEHRSPSALRIIDHALRFNRLILWKRVVIHVISAQPNEFFLLRGFPCSLVLGAFLFVVPTTLGVLLDSLVSLYNCPMSLWYTTTLWPFSYQLRYCINRQLWLVSNISIGLTQQICRKTWIYAKTTITCLSIKQVVLWWTNWIIFKWQSLTSARSHLDPARQIRCNYRFIKGITCVRFRRKNY
jgi:hypothetical protein